MIPVLRILVPVIVLVLIILFGVYVMRHTSNVRKLRRDNQAMLRRYQANHRLLTSYDKLKIELDDAIAPSVVWGSEEMLRERIYTILQSHDDRMKALRHVQNQEENEL